METHMTSLIKKKAIILGILLFIGIITGILSIVPAIDSPDYLIQTYLNENQVIVGAGFQFIMASAYLGFAFLLYPVIRKFSENQAIGFLSFRIIAGVFNIIGVIIVLLILALSKEYVNNGAPDPSYFEIIGMLLRTSRDVVNHVAMILVHCLGGLILYYALYQTKLVPRWISKWGFVGSIVTIFASLLVMFNLIGIVTPIYIALNLPMALLEIVLAIWLIIKGFDSSVINSEF